MADRAQTETLGFALVFALIVMSIGVVYTGGYTALQDVRDVERVNNAERAFEVLADNMEDITRRNAPSRATEIKLADARIFFGEPITVNVSVEGTSFTVSNQVRPIVYDAGTRSRLVYEQGAVIRTRGDSGIMVRESTLLLDRNRTVIPVVKTRVQGAASVGGDTTVLIRAKEAQTTLVYANRTSNTVRLKLTTPRASVWRQHLNADPDVNCDSVTDGTVSCRVTTDRVYVTVVQIDVSLR